MRLRLEPGPVAPAELPLLVGRGPPPAPQQSALVGAVGTLGGAPGRPRRRDPRPIAGDRSEQPVFGGERLHLLGPEALGAERIVRIAGLIHPERRVADRAAPQRRPEKARMLDRIARLRNEQGIVGPRVIAE